MVSSVAPLLCALAGARASYSPAFFWSPRSAPNSAVAPPEHLAAMSGLDVEHTAALLEHGREVHVVFLAEGLSTEAVRQHGDHLAVVNGLLQKSATSLTVPFTTSHDTELFANAARVSASGAEEYFKTHASLFSNGVADTVVVELPAAAGAAPAKQLESHSAAIELVTRAVDAGTGGNYAALLTATRGTAARGARRLDATAPPAYLHTTPTLLTAQLISLILMVIFLSGFCCLFSLQTPKRFEDTSKAS